MSSWQVYTVWRASLDLGVTETSETFPDWPTARRRALQTACLTGVRYVTLVDPDHIVVGDYDRLANYWRDYAQHIGACGNYLETEDRPCTGQLHARPKDIQVRCPLCRAWSGVRAPGMHLPFDPRNLAS